ncbi:MAG: S9 family peptidase [Bacteroidales bacterium]|nr:S9 family peptidase [Bacteroidales bacterium]
MYVNNTYSTERFGPVKWYKNGVGYTSLEQSPDGKGKDIVLYQTESADREILVSASRLIPHEEDKPLWISDYQFSEDGNCLMVFTNTQRVWRTHTRGDYWVLNIHTGKLTQLGCDLPASSLMFAKFSPNSKQVAYVSEKNIYAEDVEGGNMEQLTYDGGGNLINGTTDWAYEEEFDLRDAFRWSNDSKKIAFWQINTEGVGIFTLINNLDSIYPQAIPFAYPKVGTINPEAKIGVITLSDKQIVWMNIEGDKRDNYLPQMEWTVNADELVIQQINRRQNIDRIIIANAGSGATNVIFTEETASWTEAVDDLTWINDGKEFTWKSDRTGWLHLYLVSSDGKQLHQITKGEFEVIQSLGIDEKSGYAYFTASPENPTQRYLFRTKIDGKGLPEKLSPENETGHHSYNISPDKKYAIHTFSNHNTPPVIDIVSVKDHKIIRTLEDNHALKEKFASLNIQLKEFFRIPIGDSLLLDAYMVKPSDFDLNKKYPVIFYVYGEPAGTTVQDRWSGNDLWDYFLSQQGYIVISVDNRGTKVPRGREWKESIYKKIGIVAPFDQAAAARYILQKYDFIDKDRIGIWGWSGGGSMTLNCMFRFPEIYKTGVAVAFVSNQKFYDSFYQERYMGQVEDNEYGYKEGSPITHSGGLEGNLLLIYGSGDDNCHYQNLEVLVDKLIKENKYVTMIEYPMRTHAIREREGTTLHLRTSMYKYFLQHLPAGGQ